MMTDATPGGVPNAMPNKSNRNWPVKRNSPIRISFQNGMAGGRARTGVGRPATTNLMTVSWAGVKLFEADLGGDEGQVPEDRDQHRE
jgi:hypothetical protein